jgi:hypothetical protein
VNALFRPKDWALWLRRNVRGLVAFLFVLVVPRLPARSMISWLVLATGILVYIAARTLVLFEPGTLSRLRDAPMPMILHIGEAVIVSLALVLVVSLFGEHVGLSLPAGVLIVVGYLLYHGVVLQLAERWLPAKGEPRVSLARFILGASFVAEQGLLLTSMVVTQGARHGMVTGPWSAWEILTLPLGGIVVIVVGFLPIARVATAAADDARREVLNTVVIQVAALYAFAITGQTAV